MKPGQAAQQGWEEFERLIRNMSREDYAEACEEMASTCDSSARCVRDEIAEDEADE